MTQARILALGQRGEGVAEIAGGRVYVPFALPGEMVEIVHEGERGSLQRVLEPSADRAEALCRHFGVCGGCQLQHLSGSAYGAFKRGLVETALRHAGIVVPVAPLVDGRGNGRRRATLHVRKGRAGYMIQRSHDLYDIDLCPILVPGLGKAPEIARALHALLGDCDVGLTASDTGLDLAVRTERRGRADKLAPFVSRFDIARLSVNGEVLLQSRLPVVTMGRAKVELPPGSFLQATRQAEDLLAGLVLEGLGKARTVADLFCGMGPFALRIAERASVRAMDSDGPAVAALGRAHRHTQGLKAITAERRDLFREPMTRFELNGLDAVVIDPPRAGAERQARELASSKVPTVVSVSCDPRTFARDAAILIEGGYRLEKVTPVDQFAFSTHVEVVGLFRR